MRAFTNNQIKMLLGIWFILCGGFLLYKFSEGFPFYAALVLIAGGAYIGTSGMSNTQ